MKRSRLTRSGRLNPVGAKRRARSGVEAAVRERVFARDGGCVLGSGRSVVPSVVPSLPLCGGKPLTPHHLRKASAGGSYTVHNLVTLCSAHNDWVEDNPNAAHSIGLVIRNEDDPQTALYRRREFGLLRASDV